MNKFFKKLHLWVSVPFGIVITIICFTGALLVFESDIVALYNKDVLRVKPAGEALPLTTLIARVELGFADGVEVTGVVVAVTVGVMGCATTGITGRGVTG